MTTELAVMPRRRAVGAAIAVAVTLLAMTLGLPALADATANGRIQAGEPLTISGGLVITPAEGWRVDDDSNEFFTVLSRDGATYLPIPPTSAGPGGSAIEVANSTIESLERDPDNDWVITGPETFIADSGLTVVTYTAHSVTVTQQGWVVTDGFSVSTQLLTAPDAVWPQVKDSADEMAMSVRFEDES